MQQDSGFKPKSFWKRPEGITGLIFLAALLALAAYLVITLPWKVIFANTLYMAGTLAAIALVVFLVTDKRMRTLLSYAYKSLMRKITGVFVQLDPIGILKSYVESLQKNIISMREQIGKLRGQSRRLQTLISDNAKEIDNQLKIAAAARKQSAEQAFILASRKAARLQESNEKYQVLLQKIDVLNRVLNRMHDNAEVLLEDTRDQVSLKEQERKAIRASHSAMKSAMSIISGDPDQRAMFDMAMEQIAEDVANKVGEMERFMELSSNFMNSVDIQNGVFEEKGMQMLEEWEQKSQLLLPETQRTPASTVDTLDLPAFLKEAEKQKKKGS